MQSSILSQSQKPQLKIAVEGCCHGELDDIYATLQESERAKGIQIDLLICCGDFEAVRNDDDLSCMAVPLKFRHMKSYHKYYSGERKAPYLTIFIGGNHEAINHLHELYYGGWVAPNIYFLGYAGVVNFRGIRIGGLSGIYKKRDYYLNHYEYPPYNESTMKSSYHVRQVEVERLKLLNGKMDIFLSHDWPHGVVMHGDYQQLLRFKPYFKDEIFEKDGKILGNPPATQIMEKLKPTYWFSGHLHAKFAAIYTHGSGSQENGTTKFLALDKCLPGRNFLQILDIECDQNEPACLKYDKEWLAILIATHHWLKWMPQKFDYFGLVRSGNIDMKGARSFVEKNILESDLIIPLNFYQSAEDDGRKSSQQQGGYKHKQRGHIQSITVNEQTIKFLKLLNLQYNLAPDENLKNVVKGQIENGSDDDKDWPSDVDEEENQKARNFSNFQETDVSQLEKVDNPDEINLDDI